MEVMHQIYRDLNSLFNIKKKDLILFNKKTRDKNIKVFYEKKSQTFFLEKIHKHKDYYKDNKKNRIGSFTINKYNNKEIKIKKDNYKNYKNITKQNIFGDDYRRVDYFKKYFKKNLNICDFGCGFGGFLKLLKKNNNSNVCGVEVNKKSIKNINTKTIRIEQDLNDFKFNFDVITSFHVLEHLPDQLNILKKFFKKLKNRGKLILEVPHAGDLLINKLNLKHYKNFIFWSEHLILHSEKSLTKYLKKAGFKKIKFYYYQRHNFLNHINWILNDDYGGHIKYKRYHSNIVSSFYNNFLIKKKLTDTIKVVAEK